MVGEAKTQIAVILSNESYSRSQLQTTESMSHVGGKRPFRAHSRILSACLAFVALHSPTLERTSRLLEAFFVGAGVRQ